MLTFGITCSLGFPASIWAVLTETRKDWLPSYMASIYYCRYQWNRWLVGSFKNSRKSGISSEECNCLERETWCCAPQANQDGGDQGTQICEEVLSTTNLLLPLPRVSMVSTNQIGHMIPDSFYGNNILVDYIVVTQVHIVCCTVVPLCPIRDYMRTSIQLSFGYRVSFPFLSWDRLHNDDTNLPHWSHESVLLLGDFLNHFMSV